MKKELINYGADFLVRANSFELYEAFVNIATKLGVPYNSNFSKFEEARMKITDCLYLSKSWSTTVGKACALSNWSRRNKNYASYDLETQFGEALDHFKIWNARPTYENEKMKLNDEYDAEVDFNSHLVTVGCQYISFQTVEELYKLTKKYSS